VCGSDFALSSFLIKVSFSLMSNPANQIENFETCVDIGLANNYRR
jgi:hypothetical protein